MNAVVYTIGAVVLLLSVAGVIGLVLYAVCGGVSRWASRRVDRDVARALDAAERTIERAKRRAEADAYWRDFEDRRGRDWR